MLKTSLNFILFQYVRQIYQACDDMQRKKQFSYILARQVSSDNLYINRYAI